MPECFNLKQQLGHLYKVSYEPAYHAEYGKNPRVEDPWLMILLCHQPKGTHIMPWGEFGSATELALVFGRPSGNATKFVRKPWATVLQHGKDGMTVGFHHEYLDEVLALVKPRRRRRLSPEQKAKQVERLREFQFTAATRDDFAAL